MRTSPVFGASPELGVESDADKISRSAVSQKGSSSRPSRCGGLKVRWQAASFFGGGGFVVDDSDDLLSPRAELSFELSHSSVAAHWRHGSLSGSCRNEMNKRLAGLA